MTLSSLHETHSSNTAESANASNHMDNPATSHPHEPAWPERLDLDDLQLAMMQIRGLCELIQADGRITDFDFPHGIYWGIEFITKIAREATVGLSCDPTVIGLMLEQRSRES